jgi:hypothetical protein
MRDIWKLRWWLANIRHDAHNGTTCGAGSCPRTGASISRQKSGLERSLFGQKQWRVGVGQAGSLAIVPEIGISGEGNRSGDQLTALSGGG